MDDISIFVYLVQIGLIGGWVYTLIMGLLLFATGIFILCVFIGVADNYRKDKSYSEPEKTSQECLKND